MYKVVLISAVSTFILKYWLTSIWSSREAWQFFFHFLAPHLFSDSVVVYVWCLLFSCVWLFATPFYQWHCQTLSTLFKVSLDPFPTIFTLLSAIGRASQVALVVKNPPANAGDVRHLGSIPGLGRSPGGGHGNPLQYSCLENPTDRGACTATVHRIAKCQIWLKWLSMYAKHVP